MTPNEYQELSKRTLMNNSVQALKIIKEIKNLPRLSQIIIAAMKLSSEAGELNDALVKHISYGQPLDEENIIEECGDLLWYITTILTSLNASMELCMVKNIQKLQIRYPEKFTEEHAVKRLDKQNE